MFNLVDMIKLQMRKNNINSQAELLEKMNQLNDGNTYITAKELYEYGFSNYKKYIILDKNNFKIDDYYYKDKIYINESFSYPLTEEEKENVRVLVKITKLEDYKDGDRVGIVSVTLDNEESIRSKLAYVAAKIL